MRKMAGWGLIAIGTLGIIASALLYLNQPRPPRQITHTLSVAVDPAPSAAPSPTPLAAYQVPPNDPKYIAIPAIGITDTPILRLGLLKSGAIATPDTISETGWYDGSSRPGQPGAAFIYGHVSSWTADGVFFNLHKLKRGDIVTITRGDDQIFTYVVVSMKAYPYNKVDMDEVLAPVDPNTSGLNLMTCTGQVIAHTSEFNQRLVVFTKLVS